MTTRSVSDIKRSLAEQEAAIGRLKRARDLLSAKEDLESAKADHPNGDIRVVVEATEVSVFARGGKVVGITGPLARTIRQTLGVELVRRAILCSDGHDEESQEVIFIERTDSESDDVKPA